MDWKPTLFQRLLLRRGENGWHWTRRAQFVYGTLARISK